MLSKGAFSLVTIKNSSIRLIPLIAIFCVISTALVLQGETISALGPIKKPEILVSLIFSAANNQLSFKISCLSNSLAHSTAIMVLNLVLKNKIKLNSRLKKYFTNQYFMPNIQLKLIDQIKKFANTSIDISDGLLADLDKMINNQKLSYKIFLQDIPISNNLKKILDLKKIPKINCISNGDDYQVLFTASKNKMRIIKKIASNCRVKLTKIGSIQSYVEKSSIIDAKNRQISLKNKGYFHKF